MRVTVRGLPNRTTDASTHQHAYGRSRRSPHRDKRPASRMRKLPVPSRHNHGNHHPDQAAATLPKQQQRIHPPPTQGGAGGGSVRE